MIHSADLQFVFLFPLSFLQPNRISFFLRKSIGGLGELSLWLLKSPAAVAPDVRVFAGQNGMPWDTHPITTRRRGGVTQQMPTSAGIGRGLGKLLAHFRRAGFARPPVLS